MGDSECRECKRKEEAIYWNNFHSVRFFITLPPQFHHQLAIPEKFVNNVREKLAKAVSVKGPSGTTWKIGITGDNNGLFFKHGWQKFVEDHSLKENDLLIFKYNGNSQFEVTIFDPQNFCEKEDSYFARKCGHRELVAVTEKRNTSESFDVMDDISDEANKSSQSPVEPFRVNVQSPEPVKADVQSPEPVTIIRPARRGIRERGGRFNSCTTELDGRQGTSSLSTGYPVQYVSKRRPVTDTEKQTTFQLANAAQSASTKKSFIVAMRATHVYKTFFMSIPSEWLYSNIPSNVDEVILRMQEKMWNARVYRKVSGGGLMGGWKNFALENVLEEDDVCFFQLDDEASDLGTVLNVQIFRVVDQLISPVKLRRTASTNANAGGPKKRQKRMK